MQSQYSQYGLYDGSERVSQSLDMSAMASALPHVDASTGHQPYKPQATPAYPMPNDYQYGTMPSPLFGQSAHLGTWGQPTQGSELQFSHPSAGPAAYGNAHNMTFDPFKPRKMQPNHSSNQSPQIPVPSSPRGPPRKPKQSGHALWVGNLPAQTSIIDLKDHFSSGAARDIESVFHIFKTNCAFVNYSSEGACAAALRRFHNSRFHGRCLVCRLRKGSSGKDTLQDATQSPKLSLEIMESLASASNRSEDLPTGPLIVNGTSESSAKEASNGSLEDRMSKPSRVPARFFILKSLTLQDLQASLSTKEWSAQPHVEALLNEAFDGADNVYLFFSANRSGEYFGYARMASTISQAKESGMMIESVKPAPVPDDSSPRAIPTEATKTAPAGRIIDDTARGTIFWEADHSSDPVGEDSAADVQSVKTPRQTSNELSKNRSFSIEWLSTTTLPFYRTRGMRNLWNSNQEVKIARDGTELDPKIGWRLMALF